MSQIRALDYTIAAGPFSLRQWFKTVSTKLALVWSPPGVGMFWEKQ